MYVSLGATRGKGIQFRDGRQTFPMGNSRFRTMLPNGTERTATLFEIEVWKKKHDSDLNRVKK